MKKPTLFDYQQDAINRMHNGSILNGGVGSGKSITSLAYYDQNERGKDIYIITTARKRDTGEWADEVKKFHFPKKIQVTIDSWNNIKKYISVKGAFFIFDEQRIVGSGAWVKAFLTIAKANRWILLTATPGDDWSDYIPVFIANGFYRNRSEFLREHAVFSRWSKFPKIEKYMDTGILNRHRREILVSMEFERKTVSHHINVFAGYDVKLYKETGKDRWNPYKNEPITNISELCYIWRKITNSDDSRSDRLKELVKEHPKSIIFYNFDYELEQLIRVSEELKIEMRQWNGHKHEPIPGCDKWMYLVQYTAGAEGWNCVSTDTVIFFSQNYSYKIMEQAAGRINRLNTPFTDLYYYHLKSRSPIDLAIGRALKDKKNFNESAYVKW